MSFHAWASQLPRPVRWIVGGVLILWAVVSWIVQAVDNVQFVTSTVPAIAPLLFSPWGALAATISGLVLIAWAALTRGFKSITGREFRNETVLLDGHEYIKCKFANVRLEFNGGECRFMNNELDGIYVTTKDAKVRRTISLLKGLGFLNPQLDMDSVSGDVPTLIPPKQSKRKRQ